jgi:hypothetical protein
MVAQGGERAATRCQIPWNLSLRLELHCGRQNHRSRVRHRFNGSEEPAEVCQAHPLLPVNRTSRLHPLRLQGGQASRLLHGFTLGSSTNEARAHQEFADDRADSAMATSDARDTPESTRGLDLTLHGSVALPSPGVPRRVQEEGRRPDE